MKFSARLRSASALIGFTSALVAAAAGEAPAAAAASNPFNFTLWTNNDVTTIVACPPGTPANIVMCGYATGTPLNASNTGGDQGLSGTVTESFASELAAPAPTSTCAAAMADSAAVTIQTTRGNLYLTTSGSYCTVTGHDLENFVIVGGTGEYQGATGGGVVDAQQTSASSVSETYTGTVQLH